MKKLILVLAIVCMIGAIGIGVMNKGYLEETQRKVELTQAEAQKAKELWGQKNDEKAQLVDEESKARDKRDLASAAVSEVERTLKNVQRKLDDQQKELEAIRIEEQEIDMAVKQVFPDGIVQTPDELKMMLVMLEEDLASNKNELNTLDMDLQKRLAQKQVEMGRVGELEAVQIERLKQIALANLEATVIANNAQWGFVMVNAGAIHGVKQEAKLLVKRGNSRVAKLRIINLQDNVCVCDVVEGSLVATNVEVGDRVIFE